jgi:hypothetical protein
MTKRLQVLVDDAELRDIQRAARQRHLTTAEWVRQSLRAARDSAAGSDQRTKLEAVRTAATHSYPIADIDALLAEIESGYTGNATEHAAR